MEEVDLQEKKITVELIFQGLFEDTFSKKLLFLVKTNENLAEYNKFRSSQDFLYLRSQMLKKWVCFLIPSIPKLSYSILKPLSDISIKHKSKFLQEFLNSCIAIPEIFNCSDLQLFLKGPENYIENSKQIKIDYKEVYAKLSYREKDPPNVLIDLDCIVNKAEHLKTCLSELKTMKPKVKNLCEVFLTLQENQKLTFSLFERVEQTYLERLGERDKCDFDLFGNGTDPYSLIQDWVTRECYSMRSILEEIDKFLELHKATESIRRKIDKKKDVLRSLECGKRPISAMFSSKPNNEIVFKSNAELTELESQIKSLNQLQVLLYLHLVTKTFPDLNDNHVAKYKACMESFSLSLISAFASPLS